VSKILRDEACTTLVVAPAQINGTLDSDIPDSDIHATLIG